MLTFVDASRGHRCDSTAFLFIDVVAGEESLLGGGARRRFVPLLRSPDSYMSLHLPGEVMAAASAARSLGVEMQFRPLTSGDRDALLLYAGQTDDGRGDFLALTLVHQAVRLRSASLSLLQ